MYATETSFMVIQPAICHVDYGNYSYRIRWPGVILVGEDRQSLIPNLNWENLLNV